MLGMPRFPAVSGWWCTLACFCFFLVGLAAGDNSNLHNAVIDNDLRDEIVDAMALLRSVGVQHEFCRNRNANILLQMEKDLDADVMLQDILPYCQESQETTAKTTSSYLRQTNTRQLESKCDGTSEEEVPISQQIIVTDIIGAVVCIVFVAVISGLFMGLMTMDALTLMVKIRTTDDEEERINCQALLPFVEDHHRVLVTLLLLNGLAYEALPLFIDNLVPSWATILLSVTLVLFFGEIIPCAVFAGPNQIPLAVQLTPIMRVFLVVVAPIGIPMGKLLDYIVDVSAGGETNDDDEPYSRQELSAIIRIQNEHDIIKPKKQKLRHASRPSAHDNGEIPLNTKDGRTWNAFKREIMEAVDARVEQLPPKHRRKYSDDFWADEDIMSPPLHQAEVNMVEGALQMKTKVAMDVYTPVRKMFAVPSDMLLDRDNIMAIYSEGYSRVPVYQAPPDLDEEHASVNYETDDEKEQWETRILDNYRTSVCGILLVRHLMVIDWEDEREVSTLPLIKPKCVSPRMNLVDLLMLLQVGGCLMAFVCAQPHLADKALKADQPVPIEAGFMGLVTLEDVMEALLQDRIHDEGDVRDRDREAARLTRWAATKIQKFMKEKTEKQKRLKAAAQNTDNATSNANGGVENGFVAPGETTPLLT